jgi:hypothetical protein
LKETVKNERCKTKLKPWKTGLENLKISNDRKTETGSETVRQGILPGGPHYSENGGLGHEKRLVYQGRNSGMAGIEKAKITGENMIIKLPVCKGHSIQDYYGDYDFWCDYGEETIPEDCDNCICRWKQWGGRINPKTGRKIPWLIAFLLYGLPYTRMPICKNCLWVKGKWKNGKAICNRGYLKEGEEVKEEGGILCRDYRWKGMRYGYGGRCYD